MGLSESDRTRVMRIRVNILPVAEILETRPDLSEIFFEERRLRGEKKLNDISILDLVIATLCTNMSLAVECLEITTPDQFFR